MFACIEGGDDIDMYITQEESESSSPYRCNPLPVLLIVVDVTASALSLCVWVCVSRCLGGCCGDVCGMAASSTKEETRGGFYNTVVVCTVVLCRTAVQKFCSRLVIQVGVVLVAG